MGLSTSILTFPRQGGGKSFETGRNPLPWWEGVRGRGIKIVPFR